MIEDYLNDPVYESLMWKFVDDSPHNPYLHLHDYVSKCMELVKIGSMPEEMYNYIKENGASKFLQSIKEEQEMNKLELELMMFREDQVQCKKTKF